MAARKNPSETTRGKAAASKSAAPRRARASTGARRERGAPAKPMATVSVSEVAEIEALRLELERTASARTPMRWNADPDEVRRSVAQLVLTLIEFVRRLLERQAIRRMEAGTLNARQTEDVGRALMQLEETIQEIARTFGIPPEDLNLDLGPIGPLM